MSDVASWINVADVEGALATRSAPDPHRFHGDKDGVGCER